MKARYELETHLRHAVDNTSKQEPNKPDVGFYGLVALAVNEGILTDELGAVVKRIYGTVGGVTHRLEKIERTTAREVLSQVGLVLDALKNPKSD